MSFKSKVIVTTLIALAIVLSGCAKTPPPSLAGFVCSDEIKTLTSEEQKEKDKRIIKLKKALDNTVGVRFGRYGFLTISRGPKTDKVCNLMRKLTLEDWELLAELYVVNRCGRGESWCLNDPHKSEASRSLFIRRGHEGVAILKCEINKQNAVFNFELEIENLIESTIEEYASGVRINPCDE